MGQTADVTLIRRCASSDPFTGDSSISVNQNEPSCGTCRCRPMWCLECMARWFASRQTEAHRPPNIWLAGRVPCPTCRAIFCARDVVRLIAPNQPNAWLIWFRCPQTLICLSVIGTVFLYFVLKTPYSCKVHDMFKQCLLVFSFWFLPPSCSVWFLVLSFSHWLVLIFGSWLAAHYCKAKWTKKVSSRKNVEWKVRGFTQFPSSKLQTETRVLLSIQRTPSYFLTMVLMTHGLFLFCKWVHGSLVMVTVSKNENSEEKRKEFTVNASSSILHLHLTDCPSGSVFCQ